MAKLMMAFLILLLPAWTVAADNATPQLIIRTSADVRAAHPSLKLVRSEHVFSVITIGSKDLKAEHITREIDKALVGQEQMAKERAVIDSAGYCGICLVRTGVSMSAAGCVIIVESDIYTGN